MRAAPVTEYWLAALQMAEAWGQHPEDILEREGGALWAARWSAYQHELAKINKSKESPKG